MPMSVRREACPGTLDQRQPTRPDGVPRRQAMIVLLDVDTRLGSYELGITGPGSTEPAELGWDDLAHWHPHALRWSELDLICRAVAVRDPRLPHPGAPMALLCRFTAVFEDDDVDRAVAGVDAAYAALRPQGWDGYRNLLAAAATTVTTGSPP